MPEAGHSITCAGQPLRFHLRYSERKSLEVAVHPDGSVAVKAPLGMDEGFIECWVQKRALWIRKQLHYFAQFEPRTPKRGFVDGESHLYLGRKYRLRIRRSEIDGVVLRQGFFHITAADTRPERVEQLLTAWYRGKAETHFHQVLEQCWRCFPHQQAEKPTIRIHSMKTRWGSLSKRGGMTLNLELIKAPKECIEYVVTHELCHLFHHGHGKRFYSLLEFCLPDWARRKHKLETTLS